MAAPSSNPAVHAQGPSKNVFLLGLDDATGVPVYLTTHTGFLNVVTAAGGGGGAVPAQLVRRTVTGNAALTASTDVLYTFDLQGTHIIVQNNSASDVHIEFDAVSSAGKLTVKAGDFFSIDVPCTVLHLWSTGTPNVNGASSGNIVVAAWG